MIDAGDFGDVIDVIDQRLEWRARDFGSPLFAGVVQHTIADHGVGVFVLSRKRRDGGVALFGLCRIGLAKIFVNKRWEKVYLYHAPVLGDSAKHVVGHIASVIG